MTRYKAPEASEMEAVLSGLLCDSMTGSSMEDFTESETIEW